MSTTITANNLDRYTKDLEALEKRGILLLTSLQYHHDPAEVRAHLKKAYPTKTVLDTFLKGLPDFNTGYQSWYSEAKALIRQLLPDRFDDFVRHYERPKQRKEITYSTYCIEDGLLGVTRTNSYTKERIVGPDAAIPHVHQQLMIVRAAAARFKTSLFDIRQLVTADLFDSELHAAAALAKSGFGRAAGAIAGVILEKHLAQVCENHKIKILKKNPTSGDLNDLLRNADVLDIPGWRSIQHLADLRNLCDHNKSKEPTSAQVDDLLNGVGKISKTVF